jgi:hypothetical protein
LACINLGRAQLSGSSGGRFEVFDANARFIVIRDEEGYGVWRLDDLEEGEPMERFADDDEGYEGAAERWKALTKADRRGRDRDRWLSGSSGLYWSRPSCGRSRVPSRGSCSSR